MGGAWGLLAVVICPSSEKPLGDDLGFGDDVAENGSSEACGGSVMEGKVAADEIPAHAKEAEHYEQGHNDGHLAASSFGQGAGVSHVLIGQGGHLFDVVESRLGHGGLKFLVGFF